MKKISVIIPAYNVQSYIEDCLNSVIVQNYCNKEIILVNDGSKDDTLKIAKKILEKSSCDYKIIDKKNEGLSAARNDGITKSTGDYVVCIDSDDKLIDDNFFSEIMVEIDKKNYDMVIFNYQINNVYNNHITLKKNFALNNKSNKNDKILKIISENDLHISAWTKVVRRELIMKNNIFFEKGIFSEDISWSLQLFLKSKDIYFHDKIVYDYKVNRSGSITSGVSSKNVVDLHKIINYWISNRTLQNKEKDIILNYIAYQYCVLISLMTKHNTTKKLRKEIYALKYLLEYNDNFKVKKVLKMKKIFGIKLTSKILSLYNEIKKRELIKRI